MPVRLHWFLPTNGDSHADLSLGNAVGAHGARIDDAATNARKADLAYMSQVASAAESLGFEAALTPDQLLVRGGLGELAGLGDEQIARAQSIQSASESEGQRRMTELHRGRTDHLEVSPNLWAGIGLVRGGAGTALVGSHEEVADRIAEYHDLGIDEFILSGYPHLEEAYRVGEGLTPVLKRRAGRVPEPVPA